MYAGIICVVYGTAPSRQVVEKKAMFLVSSGLSWVNSGLLVCGSDSPVKDELSTWHTMKFRKGLLHVHDINGRDVYNGLTI